MIGVRRALLQPCRAAITVRPRVRWGSSAASAGAIGFIGLGQMGSRMAANLIKSGRPVTVFDVNNEAVDALKAKGATAASSIEALAEQSTAIITMLPATQHVREVLEGKIFGKARKGTLLIDSSTIDPVVSKALNAQAGDQGLRMVDAPVSGGVGGAEAATLTFMVGGAQADVEEARGVLMHMGKNVVHCGDAGTGGIAKICNNLVLGVNMAGVAEAMALGKSLGIDAKVLGDVLNASSGRSWVTELYNPCPGVVPSAPSTNGYKGGFAAQLMQKDLWIANEAARAVNSPLPMGALTHQLYALLSAHGHGGKDFSVLFEFLRKEKKGA